MSEMIANEHSMPTRRIHVCGAPGGGTTAVGRAVAQRLAVPHFDGDDFYWVPTNPPYRIARPRSDRVRLMQEMFLARDAWVLSSSGIDAWGQVIVDALDLVVFLSVPTEVRMARLRDRQVRQFGAAAIAPGGWNFESTAEFYTVAEGYEAGGGPHRSRPRHEMWLATLSCPVLRLDGTRPLAELAEAVAGRVSVLP